ncbi:hypothetical protein BV25DRAFT_787816 [Artomyces pyxidatus]|uniref:Uncharacterized protein n=1 Tax=Artomyces pyxidatus TaxID=48021 RepID=A0ACB8SYP7_9AGAM|nr:hypothetical protein BV25DRAFT_787816 [Artomyces pyxidatus]
MFLYTSLVSDVHSGTLKATRPPGWKLRLLAPDKQQKSLKPEALFAPLGFPWNEEYFYCTLLQSYCALSPAPCRHVLHILVRTPALFLNGAPAVYILSCPILSILASRLSSLSSALWAKTPDTTSTKMVITSRSTRRRIPGICRPYLSRALPARSLASDLHEARIILIHHHDAVATSLPNFLAAATGSHQTSGI